LHKIDLENKLHPIKKRCLSKTLSLGPSPLLEITKAPSSQCHERKTILKAEKKSPTLPKHSSRPLWKGGEKGEKITSLHSTPPNLRNNSS